MHPSANLTNSFTCNPPVFRAAVQSNKVYPPRLSSRALPGIAADKRYSVDHTQRHGKGESRHDLAESKYDFSKFSVAPTVSILKEYILKSFFAIVTTILLSAQVSFASAQEVESCGDILRYASRDVRRDVSFSDQRKYYYQKVCKSASSGFGIDYKDVTSALGFSYSSKDDYCKAEQSYDTSTSYNQADSSLVVRNSLDAYVACRALSAKGVVTSVSFPPSETPTVFSISVQRRSSVPQTVDSLAIDPAAVSCNSQSNGQVQSFDKTFNVVGFQLPQSDAQWSLLCTRKATVEPNGNRTFGPVQLILTTSSGALPISLPQIGYAGGAWATELRSEAAAHLKKLTSVETSLATQKIIAQCSGDGWFPRPAAPACPSGFKDSGQFTHSAPGGKAGFGGNCRICFGN